MTISAFTPQVYVGTYSKYNSGSIAGDWVELDNFSSKNEFYDHIKELHADEHDPEFMFQDYEGIPEIYISESWINGDFWEYLSEAKDWSDTQHEAFKVFCYHFKPDTAEAVEKFSDAYKGEMSEEDFTYNLVNDCYDLENLMGNLSSYFNYDAFQRDLFMSDYTSADGFIFNNH
jgi:antirestriction protein